MNLKAIMMSERRYKSEYGMIPFIYKYINVNEILCKHHLWNSRKGKSKLWWPKAEQKLPLSWIWGGRLIAKRNEGIFLDDRSILYFYHSRDYIKVYTFVKIYQTVPLKWVHFYFTYSETNWLRSNNNKKSLFIYWLLLLTYLSYNLDPTIV